MLHRQRDVKEALQDYNYDRLEVEFNDTARPSGQIYLQGKGAQKKGLPISLNINFKTDRL